MLSSIRFISLALLNYRPAAGGGGRAFRTFYVQTFKLRHLFIFYLLYIPPLTDASVCSIYTHYIGTYTTYYIYTCMHIIARRKNNKGI